MAQTPSRARWSERLLQVSTWVSMVRNFWWTLLTVGALVTGLYLLLNNSGLSDSARDTLLGVTVAAFCLPVGALLHRYVFRRRETPLGYRLRKMSFTYSFDPDDLRRQKQEVEIEIEARRDNVTLFSNRYNWSGQGGASQISLTSNAQVLLDNPRMTVQGWRYYYVHFLNPLLQGETAQVCVLQNLFDEGEKFEPHLSKHVRESLSELFLRVIFPDGHMPAKDEFYVVERKGFRDGKTIQRVDFEYDVATKVVSARIKKPRKGNTYSIEWNWSYPAAIP
ncbi:hypothetical protein ACVNF4_26380 [Streptomyces sp. S6]